MESRLVILQGPIVVEISSRGDIGVRKLGFIPQNPVFEQKIDFSQIISSRSHVVPECSGSVLGVLKCPFHDVTSSGDANKKFFKSRLFDLQNAFLKLYDRF